jgi:hypothetical protein
MAGFSICLRVEKVKEGHDGLPRRGLTGAERLRQLEHRIKRGVHINAATKRKSTSCARISCSMSGYTL